MNATMSNDLIKKALEVKNKEVATPRVDELDYNQEIKSYRIWDLARELEREVARLRRLLKDHATFLRKNGFDRQAEDLMRFAPAQEEPNK